MFAAPDEQSHGLDEKQTDWETRLVLQKTKRHWESLTQATIEACAKHVFFAEAISERQGLLDPISSGLVFFSFLRNFSVLALAKPWDISPGSSLLPLELFFCARC